MEDFTLSMSRYVELLIRGDDHGLVIDGINKCDCRV